MSLISPLMRIVLFLTFGLAGAAKLRDRSATNEMLSQFGVPARLRGISAILLPVSELLIAVLLLYIPAARLGALLAVILLGIFLAGILYNLARGRKPSCNCFGQIHARPIGTFTVVRNLLLAVCGAVVFFDRTPLTFVQWFAAVSHEGRIVPFLLMTGIVVLAFQAWLTYMVLQQQGRMLGRLESIEDKLSRQETSSRTGMFGSSTFAGSAAPPFMLPSLAGQQVTLDLLLAGSGPLLLLFMNPECGPCLALLPEASEWMGGSAGNLRVVVITEGTAEQNIEKGQMLDPSVVLLQSEREVADAYQAWGTPAGVVVMPDGTIGSDVAQGADAIRSLVSIHSGLPVSSPSPEIGDLSMSN